MTTLDMADIQEAYDWFEYRYMSRIGLSTNEVEMRDVIGVVMKGADVDPNDIKFLFDCLNRIFPMYRYHALIATIKKYYIEQYPDEYLIWKLSQ